MQITHQMTIDMALQLPSAPIAAVQGDGNTRILAVTLLENGEPWQIPAEAVVDVAFRKPDGTKGIYSKLPDGTDATSRDGNVLSATLAPQMLTCAGPVLATFVFSKDGEKTLAAFPFTINVTANPAAGAERSEDYDEAGSGGNGGNGGNGGSGGLTAEEVQAMIDASLGAIANGSY